MPVMSPNPTKEEQEETQKHPFSWFRKAKELQKQKKRKKDYMDEIFAPPEKK